MDFLVLNWKVINLQVTKSDRVSFLAIRLQARFTPRLWAIHGLGLQSLADCVGFPLEYIFVVFLPHAKLNFIVFSHLGFAWLLLP